jgi:hypothetical protein
MCARQCSLRTAGSRPFHAQHHNCIPQNTQYVVIDTILRDLCSLAMHATMNTCMRAQTQEGADALVRCDRGAALHLRESQTETQDGDTRHAASWPSCSGHHGLDACILSIEMRCPASTTGEKRSRSIFDSAMLSSAPTVVSSASQRSSAPPSPSLRLIIPPLSIDSIEHRRGGARAAWGRSHGPAAASSGFLRLRWGGGGTAAHHGMFLIVALMSLRLHALHALNILASRKERRAMAATEGFGAVFWNRGA